MGDPYVIGLAVAGWLATTWLAYRWGLRSQSLQREHAAKDAIAGRRRDFLAFMRSWRKDAEGIVLRYDAIYHFPKWYLEAIPGFCGFAETIRGDFTGERRKKFDAFTTTISDSNIRNAGNPEAYKKWLKIVDELIVFVDA
jgi:hypothetical protein